MTDLLKDRYELGRMLGTGGMARVVEGYDRVLDRRVAVKLMRDDLGADPKVRERFLREARTAASFTHPNAVAVYDTGAEGSTPFIVMELVEGGTLADELERHGPLDPESAIAVTDQLLAALAAAHRRGLVHRDVKPANVLLPAAADGLAERQVKLADFGIAKGVREATAGLTATGQVLGTPKYLSPEQVAGQPAGPESDVYAVGVLLYELLTGQAPFDGDNAIAVALAHRIDPVPPLERRRPGLSPALVEFVHRALAKDPAQRFPDAQGMREALRALSTRPAGPTVPVGQAGATAVLDDGDAAPTRALPEDGPVQTRRGLSPWVLVAVAALILLALAGLASSRSQQDPIVTAPAVGPTVGDPTPPGSRPGQSPTRSPTTAETAESSRGPESARPDDLPGLIALLSEDPGAYGDKGPDLLERLEKVTSESGAKQAQEARKTIDETRQWTADGQLDPDIGALAVELLEPIAASAGPERGGDQDEDEGGEREEREEGKEEQRGPGSPGRG